MYNLTSVALDSEGDFYIADFGNSAIRKVSSNTLFPTTAVGSTSDAQNVLFVVAREF
jgi:hypothetical protein